MSVCRYDPVLDQYTNLSSLPEPRTRGGADILGGLLYYVGGYTSADETGELVFWVSHRPLQHQPLTVRHLFCQ